MTRIGKVISLAINALLLLLTGWALYFASFFWIGSVEQHQQVIQFSSASYFFKRFAVNLILIVLFVGLLMLLSKLFALKQWGLFKKVLVIDVLVLIAASATMIYLSMQVEQ